MYVIYYHIHIHAHIYAYVYVHIVCIHIYGVGNSRGSTEGALEWLATMRGDSFFQSVFLRKRFPSAILQECVAETCKR